MSNHVKRFSEFLHLNESKRKKLKTSSIFDDITDAVETLFSEHWNNTRLQGKIAALYMNDEGKYYWYSSAVRLTPDTNDDEVVYTWKGMPSEVFHDSWNIHNDEDAEENDWGSYEEAMNAWIEEVSYNANSSEYM